MQHVQHILQRLQDGRYGSFQNCLNSAFYFLGRNKLNSSIVDFSGPTLRFYQPEFFYFLF